MDDGLLKAKLTKTNIPSCNPVDIWVVNKVLMEILEKECENEGGQRERERDQSTCGKYQSQTS